MRKKFLKKSFWQCGSGDIVGFLCTLPCIILMLVLLVSIIQLGSIKERLEYTAYLSCRQAVVATDKNGNGSCMDEAKDIAEKIAVEDLKKSKLKYVDGSVKVRLNLVQQRERESGYLDTVSEPEDTSVNLGKETSSLKWEKGNYVQCTVSVKTESVTLFLSGTKSASIVMMIEKPASEGSNYPWFNHVG